MDNIVDQWGWTRIDVTNVRFHVTIDAGSGGANTPSLTFIKADYNPHCASPASTRRYVTLEEWVMRSEQAHGLRDCVAEAFGAWTLDDIDVKAQEVRRVLAASGERDGDKVVDDYPVYKENCDS